MNLVNPHKWQTEDTVGRWFEAYKEIGEPYQIFFEVTKGSQTELLAISHEHCDGVGALHQIAQKYNWKIFTNKSEVRIQPQNFFRTWCNRISFLFLTQKKKPIWSTDATKAAEDSLIKSHHKFDAQLSEKIAKYCANKKISVNSYLFWCLNLAVESETVTEILPWWLPVNMRPELGLDSNDSQLQKNYVSNLTVIFRKGSSYVELHSQIRNALKSQIHWATWWWQLLSNLLSKSLIKKIILKNLEIRYAGAFSNLGSWTCDQEDSNVVVYVNTLQSHPLGAGVLTWNSCLNISLRLYPGMKFQTEDLSSIMSKWIGHITKLA